MPMPVEFKKTEIPDVLEVKTGRFDDDRRFFTETYSLPTWSAGGFDATNRAAPIVSASSQDA